MQPRAQARGENTAKLQSPEGAKETDDDPPGLSPVLSSFQGYFAPASHPGLTPGAVFLRRFAAFAQGRLWWLGSGRQSAGTCLPQIFQSM